MSIGSESFHFLLFTITQRVRIDLNKKSCAYAKTITALSHKGPESPCVIFYLSENTKIIVCIMNTNTFLI